ncbi:hypothetical protein Hanom_Chr00s067869g01787701 [Helianthus anomalus]
MLLAVLSQILQIIELTTPRVVLARPRVGCLFYPLLLLSFLLQRFQSWTRPRVKSFNLAIFLVWMWIGSW